MGTEKTQGGYICAVCGNVTRGLLWPRSLTRTVFQCAACGLPTCKDDIKNEFCRSHYRQLPVPDQAKVLSIIANYRRAIRQSGFMALYVVMVGFFFALLFALYLQNAVLSILALGAVLGIALVFAGREKQFWLQKVSQLKAISTKNNDLLLPLTIPATKAMAGEDYGRFWGKFNYRCSVCGVAVSIWGGVLQCPSCLRVLCKTHFFSGCPNHQ